MTPGPQIFGGDPQKAPSPEMMGQQPPVQPPDQGPVPSQVPSIVKQIAEIRRMIMDLASAFPEFQPAADKAIQALVDGMQKSLTQQRPEEGNAPVYGQ